MYLLAVKTIVIGAKVKVVIVLVVIAIVVVGVAIEEIAVLLAINASST